jgi:hypothetical protein
MQMGLCSMHLKISISASSTMAKHMCYVAVSETQELICDSDPEELCASDDCDIKVADNFSEDSDNNVSTDQLWHDSRRKDRAKIISFPCS